MTARSRRVMTSREMPTKAASEHVNLLGDDMADFIAALPAALVQEA